MVCSTCTIMIAFQSMVYVAFVVDVGPCALMFSDGTALPFKNCKVAASTMSGRHRDDPLYRSHILKGPA